MRNKQKGFSLIELLIVVAIILIIAAIAIPNLLRARISANEASAVSSLRTMNTACISYDTSYGQFPPAADRHGSATAPRQLRPKRTCWKRSRIEAVRPPARAATLFTYAVSSGPSRIYDQCGPSYAEWNRRPSLLHGSIGRDSREPERHCKRERFAPSKLPFPPKVALVADAKASATFSLR